MRIMLIAGVAVLMCTCVFADEIDVGHGTSAGFDITGTPPDTSAAILLCDDEDTAKYPGFVKARDYLTFSWSGFQDPESGVCSYTVLLSNISTGETWCEEAQIDDAEGSGRGQYKFSGTERNADEGCPFGWQDLVDGEYQCILKAYNGAHQASTPMTKSIVVDGTSPVATITLPEGASRVVDTTAGPVNLRFHVSFNEDMLGADDASSFLLQVTSPEGTIGTSGVEILPAEDARNWWYSFTVAQGAAQGTINLSVSGNLGQISDLAGNAVITNSCKPYLVNNPPPNVMEIKRLDSLWNGTGQLPATLGFQVTFSVDLTPGSVNPEDFAPTAVGGDVADAVVTEVTQVSTDGKTHYNVRVDVKGAQGYLGLKVLRNGPATRIQDADSLQFMDTDWSGEEAYYLQPLSIGRPIPAPDEQKAATLALISDPKSVFYVANAPDGKGGKAATTAEPCTSTRRPRRPSLRGQWIPRR